MIAAKMKNKLFLGGALVVALLFPAVPGISEENKQVNEEKYRKEQASTHTVHVYPSSAEDVVRGFIESTFNIDRYGIEEIVESSDIEKRIQYYSREVIVPGYDCFDIASEYHISGSKELNTVASVTVIYSDIGSLCVESLHIEEKRIETVYELKKEQNVWKVSSPIEPPRLSIVAAINVAEHLKTVFPERKNEIGKSISKLKQIYKRRR